MLQVHKLTTEKRNRFEKLLPLEGCIFLEDTWVVITVVSGLVPVRVKLVGGLTGGYDSINLLGP